MNLQKLYQSRPPRGFTLVELLVVVVIIAVLITLSVVGLGKFQERARTANATTAMREVGHAHAAYASENLGAINTLRWDSEPRQEGGPNAWVSNTFWGRMQPYVFPGAANDINNIKTNTGQQTLRRNMLSALATIFKAEDALTMKRTPFQDAPIYKDMSGLPIPIAFNKALHVWNAPQVRMSTLGDPSRIIYCTYGFGFINESHGRAYREMPEVGGGNSTGIFFLDNEQAIVTFVDGHIELMNAPIPARMY